MSLLTLGAADLIFTRTMKKPRLGLCQWLFPGVEVEGLSAQAGTLLQTANEPTRLAAH